MFRAAAPLSTPARADALDPAAAPFGRDGKDKFKKDQQRWKKSKKKSAGRFGK